MMTLVRVIVAKNDWTDERQRVGDQTPAPDKTTIPHTLETIIKKAPPCSHPTDPIPQTCPRRPRRARHPAARGDPEPIELLEQGPSRPQSCGSGSVRRTKSSTPSSAKGKYHKRQHTLGPSYARTSKERCDCLWLSEGSFFY